MKTGIELISDERVRQLTDKGWTPEHDDAHRHAELSDAAACYAKAAGNIQVGHTIYQHLVPQSWPFEADSWKPSKDQIRNLVKAGALIVAEIDRLQRQKP